MEKNMVESENITGLAQKMLLKKLEEAPITSTGHR